MSEILINDVVYYLSVNKKLHHSLITNINNCHKNNPYSSIHEKIMWDEQSSINVPLLYLCSIYLYIYGKKKDVDTYLFATRDCCHWIKIFKQMFPDEHVVYYNCSRNMFDEAIYKGNEFFLEYTNKCMKSTPDKCVFVDIHGTGKRIFSYFKKEYNIFPYYFLISSSYRSYKEFPKITRDAHEEGKFLNLVFDARGSPIEMLNYDIIGTMDTYTKHGAKRCKPEYNLVFLEAYHVCIAYFVKNLEAFDTHRLTEYNIEELKDTIRKIYRVIQDNRPEVAKYIKHPSKHPLTQLTIEEKRKKKVVTINKPNNLKIKSHK